MKRFTMMKNLCCVHTYIHIIITYTFSISLFLGVHTDILLGHEWIYLYCQFLCHPFFSLPFFLLFNPPQPPIRNPTKQLKTKVLDSRTFFVMAQIKMHDSIEFHIINVCYNFKEIHCIHFPKPPPTIKLKKINFLIYQKNLYSMNL